MNQPIVIAIGGNALSKPGQRDDARLQLENMSACCQPIIDLLRQGQRVVLTHGNGPQVGSLLLQNEAASPRVPANPLDVCVAQTQGSLGYIISHALENAIRQQGLSCQVATLLTRVVVDPADPAFAAPTKPIGPFYTEMQAGELAADKGWVLAEDSGRGYRRLVASPKPLALLEQQAVRSLAEAGFLVVAAGGGGIPVALQEDTYTGVEAVVDKDLASALLAQSIDARELIILTGVEAVAIHYGKPEMQTLSTVSLAQAREYAAQGHFPPGSMGPKIEAACSYVQATGRPAVITSLESLQQAMEGKAGTRIVP